MIIHREQIDTIPIIEKCFLLIIFIYEKELLEIAYESNLKPSYLHHEDYRNIY